MKEVVLHLWRQDEGQTLVEYMLVLALISVTAIGMLTFMGDRVKNSYYNHFATTLP